MFRFILISPNDQPYEPPTFLTPTDDWCAGDEIDARHGACARILDVDTDIHQHLRALGFSGVFTVEPVPRQP